MNRVLGMACCFLRTMWLSFGTSEHSVGLWLLSLEQAPWTSTSSTDVVCVFEGLELRCLLLSR